MATTTFEIGDITIYRVVEQEGPPIGSCVCNHKPRSTRPFWHMQNTDRFEKSLADTSGALDQIDVKQHQLTETVCPCSAGTDREES
jgi:hypothetical protein